jgi:DNA-directed RNA polymerase subunit K/omega
MSKKVAADTKKTEAPIESASESTGEETPVHVNSTDSLYRGVIVACLRTKQLIKGAAPRTSPEFSRKRKSTIIALEELKLGLVFFKELPDDIL